MKFFCINYRYRKIQLLITLILTLDIFVIFFMLHFLYVENSLFISEKGYNFERTYITLDTS